MPFESEKKLAGLNILITAGPTREAIDPVRFISNRSSGKMGYAVARAAVEMGAEVCLVSGPVALDTPEHVTRIDVESGQQMLDSVLERVEDSHIFIATAAVADYVPANVAQQKIKKSEQEMVLRLVKAPDILATVGHLESGPFCVGFAAETQNLSQYAKSKLQRKKADMIAANLVGDGRAFDSDTNALTVFWSDGHQNIERQDKLNVARQLVALIANRYHAR